MGASCYEDSFLIYSNYIQTFSFQACSYVYMMDVGIDVKNDAPPRFSLSSDFNSSFIDQYMSENLQENDYIVDGILNKSWSNKTHIWKQDKNKLLPSQKKMVDLTATDYGMENSLSILSRKNILGVGATTLVGDDTDKYFESYLDTYLPEIRAATEIFNNHVVINNYVAAQFITPVLFNGLSKTEKIVLIELAGGLKIPAIASKLYKSKGYIENLVYSIRGKVGGVTEKGMSKITATELIHFYLLLRPATL